MTHVYRVYKESQTKIKIILFEIMSESDLRKAVDEYKACVKIHEVWDDLKKAVCDFESMVHREEANHIKLFHLEFGVVAPLYHRLQEHLMAWGAKGHHRLPPTFEAPHRDEKSS